jgi:hypothetical protein
MSVGFSFVDSFDCYHFRSIQEKERACSRTVKVHLVLFYGMLGDGDSQNRIFLRFLRERTRSCGLDLFREGLHASGSTIPTEKTVRPFVPDGSETCTKYVYLLHSL